MRNGAYESAEAHGMALVQACSRRRQYGALGNGTASERGVKLAGAVGALLEAGGVGGRQEDGRCRRVYDGCGCEEWG